MCKLKGEGERCFYHSNLDYIKNKERLERDERVLKNNQKLTPEETDRLVLLDSTDPDTLTKEEKKEQSYLQRVKTNNSKLTATEQGHYEKNLVRRDELSAAMNTSAVANGATKRKELSLLRGDILREFALSDPNAKHDKDVHLIRDFIQRLKEDRDTPLTRREKAIADRIYLADPDRYNHRHAVTDGNGRRSSLTAAKYLEQVELVKRYENLNPALADPEHINAYKVMTQLRKVQDALRVIVDAVLLGKPLPEKVVNGLPKFHADVYRSGKLTPRIITLAITHDHRMAVYGFYAERAKAYPRLYANSSDRAAMDAAVKLIRTDDVEGLSFARLAERHATIHALEQRVSEQRWLTPDEATFATNAPAQVKSGSNPTKGNPPSQKATALPQTPLGSASIPPRRTLPTRPLTPSASEQPRAFQRPTALAPEPRLPRRPQLPPKLATGGSLTRPPQGD